MITIPGTPSNHATMYLMTISPPSGVVSRSNMRLLCPTPVQDARASGDSPTCRESGRTLVGRGADTSLLRSIGGLRPRPESSTGGSSRRGSLPGSSSVHTNRFSTRSFASRRVRSRSRERGMCSVETMRSTPTDGVVEWGLVVRRSSFFGAHR